MKKDCVCCCPSLIPSRETTHFYVLGLLIALYMLAGAAVFSSLERPAEIQAHQLWEKRLTDFSHEHKISCEDLKNLLLHYEEARTAGIRIDQGRALWDISGAFYFVGTVVSTIGFGMTAPSTVTGKVLLVFYGLLGCSATILFFNLFLERVLTLLSLQKFWCHRRRSTHRELERSAGDRHEEWKPSVYQITLILFAAVLLVACGAASLYSAMEGWTFLESLYFCFVAFSTVGFGDFVSSQRAQHEDIRVYQVANCLLMLLGVCCTYSLFNAISVIIKQGLNWLLKTLAWVYMGIRHFRLQLKRPFKLHFTDSEQTVRCSENDTLHKQQVQTFSSSAHSLLWHFCAPSAIGKCLCDEATVKTVCHRSYDRMTQGERKCENNVVSVQ
ncbi:potassium channel subfamily K member 13-like [Solea senegalensis]|uniref:Potassium channel subfamily K member 13-like n=2 Tax=Solea senegalensis TaxID=28829 RepID=A0AAV6PNR9_SOLSE|nr:potassium channel subfamily K member 13-like [Solea senegalensis]XP_043888534.1 potassium channel subfamily K member 13 [Solea senegalensis]KAG7470288.1 potassium channel subfamily K member 13-like [Solea senegalensis]KAG7480326.1 potassium channel subfamily K member 13-like [Solea senegalensis]